MATSKKRTSSKTSGKQSEGADAIRLLTSLDLAAIGEELLARKQALGAEVETHANAQA